MHSILPDKEVRDVHTVRRPVGSVTQYTFYNCEMFDVTEIIVCNKKHGLLRSWVQIPLS